MPELKPCPFCGSGAIICGGEGDNYYVTCKNKTCFCSLGEQYYPGDIPAHIFGDKESAAYNWNRRAENKENTLKQLRDEIAAYMNELSGIYENESEIFIPDVVNKLRQLLAVSL